MILLRAPFSILTLPVLTTVLPSMTLPLWHYDVDNPEDRQMGVQLWQRVCPSFRKLRVVLQYASQIACARRAERITSDILAETLRLILIPQLPSLRQGPREPRRSQGSQNPQDGVGMVGATGPYEAASEQRPPRQQPSKRPPRRVSPNENQPV